MDSAATPDERPLVLSPELLVLVRRDGVQIQRPVLADPVYLDLGRLHLLALLAADPSADPAPAREEAARLSGIAADDLRSLVFELRLSQHLQEGDPWTHREATDHPSVATTEPFDLTTPDLVSVRTPLTLRLTRAGYEVFDHEGLRWLVLDPVDAHFVSRLAQPHTPRGAIEAVAADPAARIDDERAARILGLLDGAGLLRRGPAEGTEVEPGSEQDLSFQHDVMLAEAFQRHFDDQNDQEATRRRQSGEVRPRVVPVGFDLGVPAGLTMLVAFAKQFDGGRLDRIYELRTDWLWDDDHLEFFTAEPAVYLFSNYLWSHERCLDVSRRVKELSPASITVHGGPDTPKYESDVARYFQAYPHVDVTVRGEGEQAAAEVLSALAGVIGTESPDLSVLADVSGISYRTADGPARTADRDRIADLDAIPSPFLTGLVDVYAGIPGTMVTMETNRGCPYGCTFCDWGSATTSRVRKYDLERVYDELAWCADHGIEMVSVADANFGMFARDVEIAEELARQRARTGFPKSFGVSYAKNTVKHLQEIIGILSDAGVMSQGVLSLQSMDADTLQVIHRSNIKTERYDALADRMREAQLPLMVELMMGLPGQTVDSFAGDLQECIEREVPARINRTTLLVNSPMNDPEYLAENQIRTREALVPGRNAIVISTATFTETEWGEMERLRLEFGYFENYGVLRLLSRYVRQHAGIREIDLYREMGVRVLANPTAWPTLTATVTHGSAVMAPIHSWTLLMDDLRTYLRTEYGVEGTGLDAVIAAQRAILPAAGRRFPAESQLDHDVVGWYQAMLAAKGAHVDAPWTDVVPHLEEFPSGTLVVDDPDDASDLYVGLNREAMSVGVSWELVSPLSRAHIAASQLPDWVIDRVFPQREGARPTEVSISRTPTRTG